MKRLGLLSAAGGFMTKAIIAALLACLLPLACPTANAADCTDKRVLNDVMGVMVNFHLCTSSKGCSGQTLLDYGQQFAELGITALDSHDPCYDLAMKALKNLPLEAKVADIEREQHRR
jgi:hypothetical protein